PKIFDVVSLDLESNLSLDFNGDLYDGSKWISSNIVSIDKNVFATENYVFKYGDGKKVFTSKEKILKIRSNMGLIYVLTNNNLYLCDHSIHHELTLNYAIDICIGEEVLVLEKNGNVYSIDRI